MVLRLAAALDVPLRQVNAMLRAADHAPHYPEAAPGGPLPASVRSTLELMKQHHEPFPLVVIDRTYRVVDLNEGALGVLGAVVPSMAVADLAEVNLARLTIDPAVGGQVVVNHEAVRSELLWRMQRELLADPDDGRLRSLVDELIATAGLEDDWREPDPTSPTSPTLELRLRAGEETWSFRLVVSALQAPLEVVLDEIRIEQWFPADDLTAAACRRLASR